MQAKKQPLSFKGSDCSQILCHIPCSSYKLQSNDITKILNNKDYSLLSNINIKPISDFLQDDINYDKYSIPDKVTIDLLLNLHSDFC